MNIVKCEVMVVIRERLVDFSDPVSLFLLDSILNDTWVECENYIGVKHRYFREVEGWILGAK